MAFGRTKTPEAAQSQRITYRDPQFAEFHAALDEWNHNKEILKRAKAARDDGSAAFFRGGAAASLESRVAARAEALKSGSTATIAMPPAQVELEENILAAERLVADSLSKIKRLHVGVKMAIGKHNLQRWRSIIARNRAALLELQAAADEMRSERTLILFDMGEGEPWGSPKSIVGGQGEPGAMIAPLSISNYRGENEFVHHLKAQVAHFAEPAAKYLEATSNG